MYPADYAMEYVMQRQDSTHPTGVSNVEKTKDTRTITAARKRKAAAAVEMKLEGAGWGQIAEVLGYPTQRSAIVATESCLRDMLMMEDRAALRQYASMRIDRILASLWAKATDPEDEAHLPYASKALEALRDHRKLWGLDEPTQIVVSNPTLNEIEAWVAKVQGITAPQVQEFDIIEGEWEADAVPSE